MKVVDLLASRQQNWKSLEDLCARLESSRGRRNAEDAARFAALYRSACADLALADAYQLPPGTVHFLHQLVARAHNQLYRSRAFSFQAWRHEMFHRVPQRLFQDKALRLAFVLFWGVFLVTMYLSSGISPVPGFAEGLLGRDQLEQFETMYAEPIGKEGAGQMEGMMAGFYVRHNTGIGLRCFAAGLLLGVGGLFATVYNAAILGSVFGHMSQTSARDNFFNFVTAHGPFELTAIVLSAAVGMKLGFSLVGTQGLARADSLRRAAAEAMPAMGVAMVLFVLAAIVEGFISPSQLPYDVKASVAGISVLTLFVYFVLLGFPRKTHGPGESTNRDS